MNKCKNCGSTAQFKLVSTEHLTNSLVEVYECQGCGYIENTYYTYECTEGCTPDYTFIYRDRRKRE